MKTSLLIKVLLGFPLILVIDYVLMAFVGGGASFFGAGNDFYCGPFCFIGKGILLLSAVFFLIMFLPELKQLRDLKKHAPSH